MSKLFKFIMASALLLNVLSCSQQETKTVITIWEYPRWKYNDDRFGWLKEKIAEFQKVHPDVEIRLTPLSWKSGEQKKRIAEQGGFYPDVCAGNMTTMLSAIRAGIIEDVTDCFDARELNDYYENCLKGFQYKDRIYGFPWYFAGDLLYLNVDKFRKKGIEPPVNGEWTFEEFVEKTRELTSVENYGFVFHSNPGSTQDYPFMMQDGSEIISTDLKNFMLTSPEGRSGYQKLVDIVVKHKVCPPGAGGISDEETWTLFRKQRKCAVAIAGLWGIPTFRKENMKKFNFTDEDYFEYDIAEFPKGKSGKTICFVGVGGYFVYKQNDAKKKKLIVEFLKTLTSPENQKILKEYGMFPVRKSAGDIYDGDPFMKKAFAILSKGTVTPAHPDWQKIDDRIHRFTQLVLLKKISTDKALKILEKEINTILEYR